MPARSCDDESSSISHSDLGRRAGLHLNGLIDALLQLRIDHPVDTRVAQSRIIVTLLHC